MSHVWNPGAKPETVGAFLAAWCYLAPGSASRLDTLHAAYECYCRSVRRKDLTLGEFAAELERRGFQRGERHGAPVWLGIGMSLLEDGLVQREYGARYSER